MQIIVQPRDLAPKLAPIVTAVLKFPIHLVGLPLNPKVLIANLPIRAVSAKFPTHMPEHAIEVIDIGTEAVPPHELVVGAIFGFVIVREKASASDA